jgi:hypothetical protein
MRGLVVALLCALLAACAAPPPSAQGPASPNATASPSPSPTSTTATRLFCGRLAHADCLLIAALAQHQFPFATHATALVMDDTCQPNERCAATFNAVVSILIPRDPTIDYAYWPPTYRVRGVSGPETLEPWVGPLPGTLSTLLLAAGFSG